MDLRWIIPLLSLSLLAGCLQPTPATDDPVATDTRRDTTPGEGTVASPNVEPTATELDGSSPRVLVYHANGTLKGAVTYTYYVEQTGDGPLEFPVSRNATRVVVTLHWNGTGDLDPVLMSPRYCGGELSPGGIACMTTTKGVDTGADDDGWHRADSGTPEQPDSPATLILEGDALQAENACGGPGACEWTALAYANPAADATYHMQVQVYEG